MLSQREETILNCQQRLHIYYVKSIVETYYSKQILNENISFKTIRK